MGTYDVAVNRNKKRRPTKRIVGRRFAVGNAAQPVQRPVISEPSTFSLSFWAAGHGHRAGADQLDDAVMLQQTEQSRRSCLLRRWLDGQRLRIHVHHAHAEQTHDLQHVGTVGLVGGHLDEHQLALHGGFRIEVHDLQHMQQLVELFDDLLERHFLHVGRDGDAGNVRTFGGGDGQRVDVERTTGEQAGNTCQHARTVLYEHGKRMALGTRLRCRIHW